MGLSLIFIDMLIAFIIILGLLLLCLKFRIHRKKQKSLVDIQIALFLSKRNHITLDELKTKHKIFERKQEIYTKLASKIFILYIKKICITLFKFLTPLVVTSTSILIFIGFVHYYDTFDSIGITYIHISIQDCILTSIYILMFTDFSNGYIVFFMTMLFLIIYNVYVYVFDENILNKAFLILLILIIIAICFGTYNINNRLNQTWLSKIVSPDKNNIINIIQDDLNNYILLIDKGKIYTVPLNKKVISEKQILDNAVNITNLPATTKKEICNVLNNKSYLKKVYCTNKKNGTYIPSSYKYN